MRPSWTLLLVVSMLVLVSDQFFSRDRSLRSRSRNSRRRRPSSRLSRRGSRPRPTPVSPCSIASEPEVCDANAPYRNIDGSCNNLEHKNWGRSEQPFSRILKPRYDHGDFRSKSKSGKDLPSPRKISTTLFSVANSDQFDNKLTSMHMLWGQFIDHDITHTPLTEMVKCCDKSAEEMPENCIPITIPDKDPFWGKLGVTCMELRRSKAIKSGQCGYPYREQINDITSFIDGSSIYGSTKTREAEIRLANKGQLRLSNDGLLPITKPSEKCMIPDSHPDKRCFLAGDKRSNVWAPLTAIHLAFVKLHNKIALVFYNKLKATGLYDNEEDLDEKVYQETRRLIGALLQVITYGEYLPNVMGKRLMKRYRLNLDHSFEYKSGTDPTADNCFATAVFRFGHSEVRSDTTPMDARYRNVTKPVNMDVMFNQPSKYREIKQDHWMRGVCIEPALSMHPSFSDEVLNKLFRKTRNGKGGDLPAINIQRGREHGLPPYNDFRKLCRLKKATSFNSLPDHSSAMRKRLSEAYDHVDDIDLFAGAVSEELVADDAHVGPTFACLLGIQFKRFKEGDRFWFQEKWENPYSFTDYQIKQLEKVKLSNIICETTDSKTVPEHVFLRSSVSQHVRCDRLPFLDLYNWIDITSIPESNS